MCPLCLTSALITLGGAAGIGGAGVALIKRARGSRRSAPLVELDGEAEDSASEVPSCSTHASPTSSDISWRQW